MKLMSESDLTAQPETLPQSLDCWESFRFLTENPKWAINILILAACQTVPVAGQIATLGYQFEVAEALLRPNRPEGYPDFDFNKLLEYLLRGLWPFLAGLIVSLLLLIPLTILTVISIFAFMAIGLEQMDSAVGQTALSVMVCLFVGTISAGNIVMTAIMLRAGYCQELMPSFDMRFTIRFIRLTWREIIVAIMFLTIVFAPLMLLGLVLFVIGFNIVCGLMVPVQAHLLDYQLYSIYLARGGEPIPVKAKSAKS